MAFAAVCLGGEGGTLLRNAIGIQTSHARPGSSCANSGAVTPTTVNKVLPTKICLPATKPSPPNTLCQKPWLTTILGTAASESSLRSSRRPRTGFTPTVEKKSPETNRPRRRLVRPSEFTLNSAGTNAATLEKMFRSLASCWKNGNENEHPPASKGASEMISPPCRAGPLPGGQL